MIFLAPIRQDTISHNSIISIWKVLGFCEKILGLYKGEALLNGSQEAVKILVTSRERLNIHGEWLETLDQKPARHYTDGDFLGLLRILLRWSGSGTVYT